MFFGDGAKPGSKVGVSSARGASFVKNIAFRLHEGIVLELLRQTVAHDLAIPCSKAGHRLSVTAGQGFLSFKK